VDLDDRRVVMHTDPAAGGYAGITTME